MKAIFLVLSLCGLALAAAAQPNRLANAPADNLSALRTITIQLNGSHDPAGHDRDTRDSRDRDGSFAHFEVLDERSDTTRIGVHGNLPMHSHFFDRQLIFGKPARQEIATWLNRHFAVTASASSPAPPSATSPALTGRDSILVVLRDLWLSDTDPYTPDPDEFSSMKSRDPAVTRTHIRLKTEIYVHHNGQYLPLLRIDTLQTTRSVTYNTRTATYNGWEKDLAAMLRQLAEDAALAARRSEAAGQPEHPRKWITREDIRRFNQSRFDIPIFDSSNLIRGVYTGFEEFRNNAPSIHDFEVRPDNGHLALYLRNGDGSTYYTHNVWGYCNGKQVFIMRDGLLHLLRKDGNSFYFYGIDIASNSTPALSAFSGYPEQHCLYIVDMDSGQFY